ncbi:hypothetical protein Trydic_g5941 [Trypoxylus dichotomus]
MFKGRWRERERDRERRKVATALIKYDSPRREKEETFAKVLKQNSTFSEKRRIGRAAVLRWLGAKAVAMRSRGCDPAALENPKADSQRATDEGTDFYYQH